MVAAQDEQIRGQAIFGRDPSYQMDEVRRSHAGVTPKLIDLVTGSFNKNRRCSA